MIYQAHRIRLDPTAKQRDYFMRVAGTARLVWNLALAEWNRQYDAGSKPKASDLKKQFNAIKYEKYPWLRDMPRDSHSEPFAKLQSAFNRFFAKMAKHPQFKKKGSCRDSFYVANDLMRVAEHRVRLPKIGYVRMAEMLRFSGKIMSATVSREATSWYISIIVETRGSKPIIIKNDCVGIDLGIKDAVVLSTGEKLKAPNLRRREKRLRRLQRRMSRKQLGSKNRDRVRKLFAKEHYKIKCAKNDFIHKTTTSIVRSCRRIVIEDLNVRGMLKNHKLARAVQGAKFSEFRRQLTYKSAWRKRELVVADRFFPSSKTCSACGLVKETLSLSERVWTCECGVSHDRDVNAAKNLASYIPRVPRDSKPVDKKALVRASGTNETGLVEAGTATRRRKA